MEKEKIKNNHGLDESLIGKRIIMGSKHPYHDLGGVILRIEKIKIVEEYGYVIKLDNGRTGFALDTGFFEVIELPIESCAEPIALKALIKTVNMLQKQQPEPTLSPEDEVRLNRKYVLKKGTLKKGGKVRASVTVEMPLSSVRHVVIWCCNACGEEASGGKAGVATWHLGVCDVCGDENAFVTEPRDFRYPDFKELLMRYGKITT